jgi:hypothetical protein
VQGAHRRVHPDREKANFCTFFTFKNGVPEDNGVAGSLDVVQEQARQLFGSRRSEPAPSNAPGSTVGTSWPDLTEGGAGRLR